MSEVKNVVDCIQAGVALAVAIDESQEDGFQFSDIFALVPAIVMLPEAIKDINQVPNEIKNLDAAGKAAIEVEIEKLDFKSEKSEEIAKQSLIVMTELGKLIMVLREAKK